MKIEPFCAWGDGPDVGINLTRIEQEGKTFISPNFWALDFTAAEARELAAKLIACAETAEWHERAAEQYFEQFSMDNGD